MGRRHASVYQKNPNVVISGFYDVQQSLATNLASEFNASIYKKTEDAILNSNIDAVSICTPNALHYEILKLAAESGKNILVEKPIVTTKEHCNSLMKILRRSSIKVMVGHTQRFYPCNVALKSILDSDKIGIPKIINCFDYIPGRNPGGHMPAWIKNEKFSGGGILMTDFIHTVDKISWLFHSPIKKVNTIMMSNFLSKKKVEDAVVATMQLENGVVATCIHGCPSPGALDMSVKIIGTKGETKLEFAGDLAIIKDSISHIDYPAKGDYVLHSSKAFSAEIDEFVNCIIEDRQPSITYKDGIKAVRIILALYESFKKKHHIDITN